jgi:hypothetical protein
VDSAAIFLPPKPVARCATLPIAPVMPISPWSTTPGRASRSTGRTTSFQSTPDWNDSDVYDEAFSLDRTLIAAEPAKKLRLVILDACRDNPFAKSMKPTRSDRACRNIDHQGQ